MHSLKSHPVPTFYDTDEVPQQLPVLSSQSEMYYLPKACVRVSAMEEMALLHLPMAISTTNAESHMSIARTSSRTTAPREEMPVLKPRGNVARKSVTIIEDHGESSSSPLSSESSLSSWDEDDSNGNRNRKKIPKPNGEVGRPGWGGYNLEDQLGWGKDSFKNCRVLAGSGPGATPTEVFILQDSATKMGYDHPSFGLQWSLTKLPKAININYNED
ncbi:hypothetical protein EDD16DRAFT_1524629 [Pisolithus croceorrhizus]|nr:hypothetical protein EDD16DRAFT_1524629 [Pisolithus croceorrhizus]